MPAIELINTPLFTDPSLKGYWRMEDTNGSTQSDSSPDSYTLQIVGGQTQVAGMFGKALSFDGLSKALTIVNASSPNLDILGSQTFTAWVNLGSVAAGEKQIMCRAQTGGTKNLSVNGANLLFRLLGLTGAGNNITSSVTMTTGVWYFVAGRYDSVAGELAVFVNLTKDVLTGVTGSPSSVTDTFAIGKLGSTNSQWFNGVIDDAAVFNRALTDTELNDLFTGNFSGQINLSDTVNISESIQRSVSFVKNDSISTIDTLSIIFVKIKSFFDTITASDTFSTHKNTPITVFFNENVIMSEFFQRFLNGFATGWNKIPKPNP